MFGVSDIKYIHTQEGLLYLNHFLDIYDSNCIGWSTSDERETEETSLTASEMVTKHPKLS